MDQKHSSILTANLACFCAMFFWAVGFPAIDVLLDTWGALALITVRFSIAATILVLVWAFLDGWSVVRQANWGLALLVGGLGFGIGTILLMIGQKLSDPVTPAIAASMMPIFGAILEILFDGRKLRPLVVVGIILALTGGYLATGVQLSEGEFGMGALLCLIAVVLFSWATRANTQKFKSLSPIGQTTVGIVGAFVLCSTAFFVSLIFGLGETTFGSHSNLEIGLITYAAVFSICLAQGLWIWGAGKLGILLASFHTNAVPFYVMIVVVVVLGGEWNWWQAAGACLVAAGVIIAQLASRRQWTSDQTSQLIISDVHNEIDETVK
ncbi:DMT family transporter [Alphaproteobacteria bacterium]|nr:DMT family transporter [Alphaproteobacteria bacterium]